MKSLIAALVLSIAFGGVALAGKTYRYRCTKCGLVQEYTSPGTKKCPNDGRIMVRMN